MGRWRGSDKLYCLSIWYVRCKILFNYVKLSLYKNICSEMIFFRIVAFSITNRKHHCRNCGQIFCSDCSSKQATMENYKKPQRVCESCFGELQQGKWHEFPHAGNASNRSEPNFYNDTVEQSPSANINHSQRSSRSSLWNEQVH